MLSQMFNMSESEENWLDEHGIKYTERHIAEKNPTYDELKVWYQQSGLPIKKFFEYKWFGL